MEELLEEIIQKYKEVFTKIDNKLENMKNEYTYRDIEKIQEKYGFEFRKVIDGIRKLQGEGDLTIDEVKGSVLTLQNTFENETKDVFVYREKDWIETYCIDLREYIENVFQIYTKGLENKENTHKAFVDELVELANSVGPDSPNDSGNGEYANSNDGGHNKKENKENKEKQGYKEKSLNDLVWEIFGDNGPNDKGDKVKLPSDVIR